MKNIFGCLLFLIGSLFTSCDIEPVKNAHQQFFDINDFLDHEIKQLSELKSIKKKVEINGKIDEQVLEKFDLAKDLTIFQNSNINKIAWLDKYEVDSTLNNAGQLSELKYLATDVKLKTRELTVVFANNKVKSIFIKNASKNQVSELNQSLQYHSLKGYSVENKQEVSLNDQQQLKIEVEYL